MLEDGRFASVRELAEAERVSLSHISWILRLTLLAPDVVERILDGRPAPQFVELMQPFQVGESQGVAAAQLQASAKVSNSGSRRIIALTRSRAGAFSSRNAISQMIRWPRSLQARAGEAWRSTVTAHNKAGAGSST